MPEVIKLTNKCPICQSDISTDLFILPESPRGNFQQSWYCNSCDLSFSNPNEVLDWCRKTFDFALKVQEWVGFIKWIKNYEKRSRGVKRLV